jgi:hypothetical protein
MLTEARILILVGSSFSLQGLNSIAGQCDGHNAKRTDFSSSATSHTCLSLPMEGTVGPFTTSVLVARFFLRR